MSIWAVENPALEALNSLGQNTLVSHLGIVFTAIGDDYLCASMPVDSRTVQSMQLLHGGASAALAETRGSVAASLCIPPGNERCVGLEINANHIRAVGSGSVVGTARPLYVGRRTHVWQIELRDEDASRGWGSLNEEGGVVSKDRWDS